MEAKIKKYDEIINQVTSIEQTEEYQALAQIVESNQELLVEDDVK